MDRSEAPPEPPARVPVSTEWLAEQDRRQAAYAAARRARAAAWEGERPLRQEDAEEAPAPSPALPAPPSASPAPVAGPRPRGPIADPRQERLF